MSYGWAVMLLLLAVVLRLWQLAVLPPGPSAAELRSLVILDEIRAGRIAIMYQAPQAPLQEGLYHTTLALHTLFSGSGTLPYRLLSFWAGMLTLALLYTLAVRLFGHVGGLAALGLGSVMLALVLLARAILPEVLLPLLVTAALLALARAFPVYRRLRDESTNTTAFAAVGVLLGIGLYIHPAGLLLVLVGMVFISYMVFFARHEIRRLSYVGFALLMFIIVSVPYLIYMINRPEANAGERILGQYHGLINTMLASLGGIAFRGDANPAQNLMQRPLVDLISGVIIVIGALTCARYWRVPRLVLPLLAALILAPGALLAANAPNFFAFAPLLPVLTLLFGAGVMTLVESVPIGTQRVFYVGLVGLLAFNIVWVARDLFDAWAEAPEVAEAYHQYAGRAAHYLDTVGYRLPTILCDTHLGLEPPFAAPSGGEIVLRLLHRPDIPMRRVNCLNGLVFTDGGGKQQIILPEPELRARMHPYLQTWLADGQPSAMAVLPPDAVLTLDVTQRLADRVGLFTTTAPARLPPEAQQPDAVALPPVRFGENVTWLGYEDYDTRQYKPGDVVTVITYWRAEGVVPPDLNFFLHILSDPVTIVRQQDALSLDARSLRDRDVYIQVTQLDLTATTLPGEYTVSIGAYQDRTGGRLPVLIAENPNGDRLLLYTILVQTP